MKSIKLRTTSVLAVAIILLSTSGISAQRGYGYGFGNGQGAGYYCNNIPDLTADQKNQITSLRTAHLKKMQDYRNQMSEKRVKLQTLRTADNADMAAIDKTIDEMSKIRTKMQKDREQHFQNVRKILTADQRVYFDNRPRGAGYGYGYGRCGGRGYGFGGGKGYGRCRAW